MADMNVIGASVKRKEDYRFLTGAGTYTDDVTLPHQSYACFVRSPHAHAKVKAIKKDKARTNILKISELGLVEMTRQRTRESLENVLLSACPYCEGRGRIKSHVTIAYEILRAIKREKNHLEDGKRIQVRVHPDIANFLYDDESRSLDNLEREINRKIIIKASEELHHQKYEISAI